MYKSDWILGWHRFLESRKPLHFPESYLSFYTFSDIEAHPEDENFWDFIQGLFPQPQDHINLNHGGVSSCALLVEKAYCHYYSLLNTSPSFYTWKVMEHARRFICEGLGLLLNCPAYELAIFRNATEALCNAIFGIKLSPGDEVVVCRQDYIKCVTAWQQRELRDKITIRWVDLDGTENNDTIIAKYKAAFTEKSKVLHLTHIINWNGMVMPIKEIIQAARQNHMLVVLDAAHSLGILQTDVRELDCDYLAASLHKWLAGPVAGGLLYIKDRCISDTWPLLSASEPRSPLMLKFEELSLQNMPYLLALGHAIALHLQIGREAKEKRLRYLRKQWTDILQMDNRIRFLVPLNDEQCAGFASFAVKGISAPDLEKKLMEKHQVHVVGFTCPGMEGVRVTPNVFTPLEHIGRFVHGLHDVLQSDI